MFSNHSPLFRSLLAALFVLIGSVSIQISSTLATSVFSSAGTLGTSGLRFIVAAGVLLLIVRPRVRGLSRRTWLGITLYGVAMAAMNVLLYNSLERVSLGTAVTLEFLGPLVVASIGAKGRLERVLPVLTLAGVALVAGPSDGFDGLGITFGLGAAIAFGAYTFLAERVGETSEGIQGLSLSITIGALLLLPFSLQAAPKVEPAGWVSILVSGVIGVTLAYTLDFLATKLTSPRVVGTLFAVDPAAAAIVGAVALNQSMSALSIGGIALVIASGATVIWRSGKSTPETSKSPGRDLAPTVHPAE